MLALAAACTSPGVPASARVIGGGAFHEEGLVSCTSLLPSSGGARVCAVGGAQGADPGALLGGPLPRGPP